MRHFSVELGTYSDDIAGLGREEAGSLGRHHLRDGHVGITTLARSWHLLRLSLDTMLPIFLALTFSWCVTMGLAKFFTAIWTALITPWMSFLRGLQALGGVSFRYPRNWMMLRR
ncbi:hypothetical protein EYF80_056837 [Liparis tanakae]|uniref:Uncharacterized protein n=1 Tax=Liparis tanakae TaxID=230148 RepID=A0A4Z2EXM5_9TELE|nr:hypothetical protein EYF80_056837 [Liparis tanakae]